MKGKVKKFNDGRGFGFINTPEINKDIFVHYSQIVSEGYRTLKVGQEVEFDLKETDRGLQAMNVR